MPAPQKSAPRRMRELMEEGIVVSPGVYDGYSARLVEKMGYKAASTSGAGFANSLLGQPDVGILSWTENATACQRLVNCTSLPIMADADTGYGNAVTVYHVVQYFEATGVVGINLEDQVSPKRCGHMRGKDVISTAEMCKKVEAAVRARKDPDFILNIRTDALAVEGFDGAVKRARAYVSAGADMVYADAIETEEQIKRFVEAVAPTPVSINMGFGIRSRPTTPTITVPRLAELGIRRVTFPRMLPGAALQGMKTALALLMESAETGNVLDRKDLIMSVEEITDLMGYALINQLEKEFTLEGELQRRYKDGAVDLVVHAKS